MSITRRSLISGAAVTGAVTSMPFSGALSGLLTPAEQERLVRKITPPYAPEIETILADMQDCIGYTRQLIAKNEEKEKHGRKRTQAAIDDLNLTIDMDCHSCFLFRKAEALRRVALGESAFEQRARSEPKYGRLMKTDNVAYERLRRIRSLSWISFIRCSRRSDTRYIAVVDHEYRAIQGDFGAFFHTLLDEVRVRA
jgi:hypothetical protein